MTSEIPVFNFATAITLIKAGMKVARTGWNGQGMYITAQFPDTNSKMQRPYIYMSPVDGCLVPWVASQSDLLSEDWYLINEF